MKKLLVLIAIFMALLFTGCCPTAPDYPECPDCICEYECPNCVCSGGSCSCPATDCICDCQELVKPEIVLFDAEPEVLICWENCASNRQRISDCYNESTISWVVVGADIIYITDEGYKDATGSFNVQCRNLEIGENTWTLTATNSVGSVKKNLKITRENTPAG